MARTDALSILTAPETADKLAELDGQLIESIQKGAISSQIKNTQYSGDPTTGSVEINRFKNAQSADYGTAREAGEGSKLTNSGKVTVNVDTDKEIIEEIANKDVKLYGISGIADRRTANHRQRLTAALDTAFFTQAVADATAITLASGVTAIEDVLEAVIQTAETVANDFVDGVDRADLVLTLSPAAYGKVRNHVDTVTNPDTTVGGETIDMFHGVQVFSNVRQTVPVLIQFRGAVAQPVVVNEYAAEKIGLSNDIAIELFYSYGTKSIMPDLIFKLAALPTA